MEFAKFLMSVGIIHGGTGSARTMDADPDTDEQPIIHGGTGSARTM